MKTNISQSIYMNFSYDDLLIFALFELQKNNVQATFENLVAKSFELFPKRFQLPGYDQWPDSSLIDKSWLRCRSDKGLINGNKSKGFTLTLKGLSLAKRINQLLHYDKFQNEEVARKGDNRTRSGRLVKHIENSLAFQKYINGNSVNSISEFEFCDLLYSTLDTDPVLRNRNFDELIYHAKVYERQDILKFLNNCKEKFLDLLIDKSQVNYEGGMMKRRKKK